jgi:hypothetical protein
MTIVVLGKHRPVISLKRAKQRHFRRFTNGYNLPKEQDMLNNAIKDLDRMNKQFVLVETEDPHRKSTQPWFEVWLTKETKKT